MFDVSEFVLRGTQSRRERVYLSGAVITIAAYVLALSWFSAMDMRMDKVFLAKRDAVRMAAAAAHPLPLNQQIAISDGGHFAPGLAFLEGWSGLEPWGVWSMSKTARFCIVVPAKVAAPLQLDIWGNIFIDRHGSQTIQAYGNGKILGIWSLRTRQTELSMTLPPANSGRYAIILVIAHPGQTPGSIDPRALGIGLISLEIRSATAQK